MVLHELTTNAAKYGALSVDSGCIILDWSVTEQRGGRELNLHWREEGGPNVTPPKRRGFGTQLLESISKGETLMTLRRDFASQGLRVQITVELP
jgi:two-component sensor histidine kinase